MLGCVTESAPAMLIVEFCNKGDLLGHMKKWWVDHALLKKAHYSLYFFNVVMAENQTFVSDNKHLM